MVSSGKSADRIRAEWIVSLVLVCVVFSACGPRGDILLFDGTGTSPGDVAAVKAVLNGSRLDYSTAGSWSLNRMDESQLRRYRLLIVPGGNFEQIGNSLTPAASAAIRNAVHHGLNYLGICAGGFFAGNSPYNGLNLTSGVSFGFYSAENRGIRRAAVPIAGAGTPALDQYWEDGPQFNGWGAVVGRYPDGTAAIVEGSVGSGWVILSGVHPEAPENWRSGMTFTTPVADDNAYAARLVRAALNRSPLPHF